MRRRGCLATRDGRSESTTDTRITRRLALALPAALAAPAVHAQGASPFGFGGNITLVVPFPAGGQSDLLARLIAERIGPLLSRSVVVENLTGAGGQIAARGVQGARADGSRLLIANTSVMVLTPLTTPNAGYDPVAGFAPVAGAGEFAAALATGAMTGAQELAELTAWLRATATPSARCCRQRACWRAEHPGISISVGRSAP